MRYNWPQNNAWRARVFKQFLWFTDKALEQSSALIPELKNLRQEVVEQLKAIKSAFENSNRVNKLVKQDIERYINALPKIYPLFEGPDGARFLKRCAETAKTRRHHEVLLKIAEELDPAHLLSWIRL